MKRAVVVLAAMSAGCAPPGGYDSPFRDIDWPTQDQGLSPAENAEIERLLTALGFASGPVDGVIDAQTRGAIRSYMAAIGAPSLAVVTAPLYQSLVYEASSKGVLAAPIVPVRASQSAGSSASPTPAPPTPAPAPQDRPRDDDDAPEAPDEPPEGWG